MLQQEFVETEFVLKKISGHPMMSILTREKQQDWCILLGHKCSHQYGSLAFLCCGFAQVVITSRASRQRDTPGVSKLFRKGPESKCCQFCEPNSAGSVAYKSAIAVQTYK